jgi:hypothetical protein
MASKQIGVVVLSCFIAITALAFRPCAGWSDAGATWYGPANGAGTDGTYVFIALRM